MSRSSVRYRIRLPVAHTLIDSVLVAAWIWHGYLLIRQQERRDLSLLPAAALRMAAQDGVEWKPIHLPPPPEFNLILTGTMPAGMVSMALRPDAWRVYRHTVWDPVWFAIHEAIAIVFWFLIGARIDSGHRALVRTMWLYLCARGGFAVLSIALGIAAPGAAFQSLFWFGLFLYAILRAVWRLVLQVDLWRERRTRA
jgi:hypothetical protein